VARYPALYENYPDSLVSASVIGDNQWLLNGRNAELATHMYYHFLHTHFKYHIVFGRTVRICYTV